MKSNIQRALACGAILGSIALAAGPARAAEPTLIELTQVGCQFLESENEVNHGYQPTSQADCEAVNENSSAERLAKAKTITLAPGKYRFRVTNRDVPYPLGFWLRGDGLLNRAKLPSTSGGGLTPGTHRDYDIELVPGEYVYSCPLNPTPDYKLVVSG